MDSDNLDIEHSSCLIFLIEIEYFASVIFNMNKRHLTMRIP